MTQPGINKLKMLLQLDDKTQRTRGTGSSNERMTEMADKRNVLNLADRVGVIRLLDSGKSARQIALQCGCGKTQISKISAGREGILKEWESGGRSDRKYVKRRKTQYEELNTLVWEWFRAARSNNLPTTGRRIQEKARTLAASMHHEEFSGSNGWLESWQKRYGVKLGALADYGCVHPTSSSTQSDDHLKHKAAACHPVGNEADLISKEDIKEDPDKIVDSPQRTKHLQNAFTVLQQNSIKSPASCKQSPRKSKLSGPNAKSEGAYGKYAAKLSATGSGTSRNMAENVPSSACRNEPVGEKTSSTNTEKTSHSRQLQQPLAERLRPVSVADYVGQDHIMGRGRMLRQLIMSHRIPSMILWGPPGCGKTTLARIISAKCEEIRDTRFVQLSAASASLADVREVVKIAKNELKSWKRQTVLFMDEIHRFNKLQQDSFLPHIEDGTIVLIGATTENPSFYINNALLSRCKVVVLEKLSISDIEKILHKGVTKLGMTVLCSNQKTPCRSELCIQQAAITSLASHCDGDARSALNTLQAAAEAKSAKNDDSSTTGGTIITVDDITDALQRSHIQYDKTGEEHYNCISALQKSIRGSDDGAAIYWLTRMLEGGEDPMYIARRLVVCASEDIGLADPQALVLAIACQQACHLIGAPECSINLAHCVTYLARAPKSNEAYLALKQAQDIIRNHKGAQPSVPLHLRNAPTKLMKNLGYGDGYKYNHSFTEPVEQEYLPKDLRDVEFFKKD